MHTESFSITDRHIRSAQPLPGLVYPVWSGVADLLFDQDYLSALRDRNPDAENFLIAHFSRPVQLKLRARLRSPELVQDASQETFLRVLNHFRSGKTLDNPASLPGFVHSVCHRTALELLRAHTRQSQLSEDAPEMKDTRLSTEDGLVTRERKELVARILNELTERDRRLLRRVFLDEEDKDTVCSEFQVNREYLRLLIHRACNRFRAVALRKRPAAGGR